MLRSRSTYAAILLAAVFAGCSVPEVHPDQPPPRARLEVRPPIKALRAALPLFLGRLDPDTTHDVPLPAEVQEQVARLVERHYFATLGGDSAETFFGLNDILVRTVQLDHARGNWYVVVLDSPMEVGLEAKLFGHDTVQGPVDTNAVDLRIWAMYHREGGQGPVLIPSNLDTLFLKDVPDLARLGGEGDAVLRATRLLHNGTFNALETRDLVWREGRFDTLRIDTVSLMR